MEDCLPWEGPHTGAGEECEEEEVAETTHYELTATPIPHPLCCSGEGGREVRSEVEPEKKDGVGGRCVLRSGFISYHPTLI